MSTRVLAPALVGILTVSVLNSTATAAAAQSASDGQQPPPDVGKPADQHDMQHMHMEHADNMFMVPAREGSGTAWLPDETPMYASHRQAGRWALMAHGNAFVQYLREGGDRGSEQFGSVNWFMAMADRTVGSGHLGLRGMISLEPWTIRGCGYPDLLASGELCQREAIHDRQHPHDLFMELAATYDRAITGEVRVQFYGGPVGEPALGPPAFPHRISAMPNPLAPITHHWFDATHITYGVMTGGVYGRRWKVEASAFNGREPDEHRTNLDFDALDSWSARLWLLPTDRWALQVSTGHLTEAEAGHDGGPRVDVDRVTASATYHRALRQAAVWANTVGWGRNHEPGNEATNAVLAETSLTLNERDTWFGRFELSQKSAHDLAIESHDLFTVAKAQAGYTRYLSAWNGLTPGLGAGLSAGIVPDSLKTAYGRRINVGFGVFVTVRPGRSAM